ncbi:hypothetical protein BDZ89DRAFT_1077792 [Hymenopellis radicata]|nr:hypothetical protein BDZ89DRAFT_1077792 [Hymenopellis radicata]
MGCCLPFTLRCAFCATHLPNSFHWSSNEHLSSIPLMFSATLTVAQRKRSHGEPDETAQNGGEPGVSFLCHFPSITRRSSVVSLLLAYFPYVFAHARKLTARYHPSLLATTHEEPTMALLFVQRRPASYDSFDRDIES